MNAPQYEKPTAAVNHATVSRQGDFYGIVVAAVNDSVVYEKSTPITSRDDILPWVVDAVLECWKHRTDHGLALYISETTIRNLLAENPDSFTGLELRSLVVGARLQNTWQLCSATKAAHHDAIFPRERPKDTHPNRPNMVVATDASKRFRDRNVGIAAVSTEGWVHARTIRANTIMEGEFEAVTMAVDRWGGEVDSLDILTDNTQVYRVLNSQKPIDKRLFTSQYTSQSRARKAIQNARDAGVDVRIHWVRGHNDHPLNELADRAAVSARRCDQWSLSARRFLRSIREDLATLMDATTPEKLIPEGNDIDSAEAAVSHTAIAAA